MKYFFISAFLHSLIIIGLSLKSSNLWDDPLVSPAAVTVELLPESYKVSLGSEVPKFTKKPRFKKNTSIAVKKSPDFPSKRVEAMRGGDAEQKQVRLSYIQALNAYISQNKFYPRQARKLRQSGTVSVRFHINSEGEFHHVHLERGCNHKALNSAAIQLINKLGKFKPLPKKMGASQDFVVPIQYRMTRGS